MLNNKYNFSFNRFKRCNSIFQFSCSLYIHVLQKKIIMGTWPKLNVFNSISYGLCFVEWYLNQNHIRVHCKLIPPVKEGLKICIIYKHVCAGHPFRVKWKTLHNIDFILVTVAVSWLETGKSRSRGITPSVPSSSELTSNNNRNGNSRFPYCLIIYTE